MNTFRHVSSPIMIRFNRPLVTLAMVLAIALAALGTGFPGHARAADNIGIYWDTNYVQDATTVSSFPGLLTGYLVIKNPTVPFGVVGWELCADISGPGQLAGWTLSGSAINAASPPCFAVGIGPVPLRSDGDVLLATVQVLVTGPEPVAISVSAPDFASVPDQMSYVPYNSGDLLPLTTLSGTPEVAFINDPDPHFAVYPGTLHFDDSPIGFDIVQSVTVTNFGGSPGSVDIALAASGCEMFSLPGISGPVTIPVGESIEIAVSCNAQSADPFACSLTLGGGVPDVQLVGNGYEATLAWEAPTELDFEEVVVGSSETRGILIRNVGDMAFEVDPSIIQPCGEFTLVNSTVVTVQPGETATYHVIFTPAGLGPFSCSLDLGATLPPIDLIGEGRDAVINWNISPASLDFGEVGVGATPVKTVTVTNTGEGPFDVTPTLPGTCPEFTLPAGGTPISLAPGESYPVSVQFSPTAEGVNYACDLGLGGILPTVPLTGSGQVTVIDWIAPTSHDFGAVGVGQTGEFVFSVTNTGNVGFLVDPVMAENSPEFSLAAGHATFLNPGDVMNVGVLYQPLAAGLHTGVLGLGAIVPGVQLSGEGTPRPAAWSVVPNPLEFGWHLVGTVLEETVVISNLGGTVLDLDVGLARLDLGYTIVSGGGVSQLPVASTHEVVVRFVPAAAGQFTTALNIGPEIGSIPVDGWGQEAGDVCSLNPGSLNFGTVSVGNSTTRTFTVSNNGITSITVNPSSDSPHFNLRGGPASVSPGQTVYYSVTFEPLMSGVLTGTIDLGSEFCADLPLTGEGTSLTGPGQDMVGIFFDPAFSVIEAQTFGTNEIVEGYLVLVEPSDTSGVGAWELSASIIGDATWLSWSLEGQNINVGTYDDFIVGIGGSPLPYAPSILLATFQILIPQPYPSIVYLELGPVQTPSIPNTMVWAPWSDPSSLRPLYPFTGEPIVAGINWGSPVGVGNPAPMARVTGGEVALEWPIPDDPGDGCHVYRRDQKGSETRLTSQPVTGFGASLNYTDSPTGYASGSVLYYSYSVVTAGVEGPRSPETEIKLTGVPVVTTRLLPNVPNPFNPMTEVRFELSKPQQVRVVIYDVTGRRVKILADGHLEAGPHARVWQGRDSSGRQVPSGAYYVRLVTDGRVDHHKMMLLK